MTRPEVPQWCVDAAESVMDLYQERDLQDDAPSQDAIAAIIAKHAPQQQPQTADPEVEQWCTPMRYEIVNSNGCATCPRLWVGDRWVADISGAVYMGHDSAAYAERIVALWNEDIARHAPKPQPQQGVELTSEQAERIMANAMKQQTCEVCKGEFDTDGWCKCDHAKIEALPTDAEGNALPHPEASGVERWQ